MDGLVMTAQILLSLTILVGLHEIGHLVAAKFFGMRVEEYSIGFPPKLFKFNWKGTEYALSAIPLGGYVKISGMIDESMDVEAMKEEPKEWEFRSKPAWQRLIVMLGGIIVNVILGVFIFIGLTYFVGEEYLPKDEVNRVGGIKALEIGEEIGLKNGDKIIKINGQDFESINDMLNPDLLLVDDAFYTVERNGEMVDVNIPSNFMEYLSDKKNAGKIFTVWVSSEIGTVVEGGIAERAGIKVGDIITAVNDVKVASFDAFSKEVKNISSDSITIQVLRKGEEFTFSEYFKNDSIIGVGSVIPPQKAYITYGLGESISVGTKKAFGIVFTQLKAFKKIFSGQLSVTKSLSGPIGIAQAYGGDWEWERFWRMTGLLSMVLAFMNLLPIPALDGGHVMFLSFEILSGKKPGDKFMEYAQKFGMIILLSLMVFVIFNDIFRLDTIQSLFGLD
ncbi:MAG: RIP metalloprotease RseP [Cyclobacteriaceae bacterium]|nr:RIP metalloprotease RseP [Cyclobacteriaceae bacterium]